MKIKRSHFLFFITLVIVTACNLISPPQPEHPPLKFAYSAWPGYFPIAIAKEKGFFLQQGVNVETVILENGNGILADFSAGKFDGILSSLGEIIPISATNPDLRLVLITAESAGADAVVAQPQIKSIADLKGKVIATGLGSFGELFVNRMLEINGLTSDQVTLVNAYGEQVPERLGMGVIQAGHSWEPYVSQMVKTGARVLFTSRQTPGLMPDVITFQGKVLRDRPTEIRAFIQAWFQALEYWQLNPKEGNAIIGKVLHISPETISPEGVKFLTLSDSRQAFSLGNTTDSLYYTAQLYANFYIQTGSLTRPPDINKLLDPSFIKNSKVSSHNEVRT